MVQSYQCKYIINHQWRSTVKATHWLDMLMKSSWDMTSWQMPRLDRSKNSEWPWNVNVVQHEKVLNISDILYYREINTWWFLSEFIKLLRWNLRLMNIVWLQSVSMKCLHRSCLHRSERSWSADRVSKICFCEHREYVWQNEKIYS